MCPLLFSCTTQSCHSGEQLPREVWVSRNQCGALLELFPSCRRQQPPSTAHQINPPQASPAPHTASWLTEFPHFLKVRAQAASPLINHRDVSINVFLIPNYIDDFAFKARRETANTHLTEIIKEI